MKRDVSRLLAAIVSLLIGLMAVGAAPAADPLAPGVSGLTTRMVRFNGGAFVQVDPERWIEVAQGSTSPSFRYTLKQRAREAVMLYDATRDVTLVLLLTDRKVWYKQGNNAPQAIYDIIAVANVSRVDWTPKNFEESEVGANAPSAILSDRVFAAEELLSGDTVNVIIELFCKETTDTGEDEVYWELTTPTGAVIRTPAEADSYKQMNEDDSELERWVVNVPAKIDAGNPGKPFKLKVVEVDYLANSDDVLFDVTITPVVDVSNNRISVPLTQKSTDNYTLSYRVVDSRTAARQALAVQDFEKAPTVPDVVALLNKISGPSSTVVNTYVKGMADRYKADVTNGDHLQGIAMTTGGQLAMVMSLHGKPGFLAYSNSIYGLSTGQDLTWKIIDGTNGSSPIFDSHPSAMASTGQIIAISNKNTPLRFYYLPSGFGDAVRLDYLENVNDPFAEAIALAYYPKEDRFYATWVESPAVTSSDSNAVQRIKIYASKPGMSLLDDDNRFAEIAQVDGVPVSGQGMSMLVEDDGDIYVASNFSTDNEPPTADYAGACTTEFLALTTAGAFLSAVPPFIGPAILAGQSVYIAQSAARYPFTDVLSAVRIAGADTSGKAAFLQRADVKIDKKPLSRTQWEQFCVMWRPSWRFAGTIIPTGPGELTAIWGGRWNMAPYPVTDEVEYAIQRVDQSD